MPRGAASTPPLVHVSSTNDVPSAQLLARIPCGAVLNLSVGIENSLDAKLDAAFQALADLRAGNDQAAVNVLQAFINAVTAQSGNQISVEDAAQLVTSAQAIIDLLPAP